MAIINSINSINMTLPIPGVGTEKGPDYALDINSCLTLIDSHDHTPGRGVRITPAGLDINVDLPFNSNSALSLLNAVFTAQSSATGTLQALSVAPGSESPPLQDLWYTNSAGNKVQITSGDALAAVPTTVQGISYALGTFSFRQSQDSLPTTPANLDAGTLTIHPTVAGTPLGVTLATSGGISSQYTLTLPLPVAATAFLTQDSSGTLSGSIPIAAGIQNSMLATIDQSFITVNNSTHVVNYTANNDDNQLLFDLSAAARTLTLYSPSGNAGKTLYVQKIDSTLNALTIIGASFLGTTLNTQDESVTLMSDGTSWRIASRSIPGKHANYGATVVGFGTITGATFYSYRQGRYLVINGGFACGAPQAILATVSLGFNGVNVPTGLVTDLTTSPQPGQIGTWTIATTTVNGIGGMASSSVAATNTASFCQPFNCTPALGNSINGGGTPMRYQAIIPIIGWND